MIERDLTEPDRIVGELLQPGGYLKLMELGLEGNQNMICKFVQVNMLGESSSFYSDTKHSNLIECVICKCGYRLCKSDRCSTSVWIRSLQRWQEYQVILPIGRLQIRCCRKKFSQRSFHSKDEGKSCILVQVIFFPFNIYEFSFIFKHSIYILFSLHFSYKRIMTHGITLASHRILVNILDQQLLIYFSFSRI